LATTGATAPFVGLVGTIFGIINAFQMMEKEGATITDLAPAIGEALITTAIGIIVAIAGVWLFNFFTARIEAITNKMSVTAQVLLDWCEKQTIAQSESSSSDKA
jgi:biopolymer transport protein ExbB/TolQ